MFTVFAVFAAYHYWTTFLNLHGVTIYDDHQTEVATFTSMTTAELWLSVHANNLPASIHIVNASQSDAGIPSSALC